MREYAVLAGAPRWFVAGPHGYQVAELSVHPTQRYLVSRVLAVRESVTGPQYQVLVLRAAPGRWSTGPAYDCNCGHGHCLHLTAAVAFCGGPTDGPGAGVARKAVA